MTTVAATDQFTSLLTDLRDILSQSSAYQTLVGAADANAAAATVHIFAADGTPAPPVSVVSWGPDFNQQLQSLTPQDQDSWSLDATVLWYCRLPTIAGASSTADAAMTIGNRLGATLRDIVSLAIAADRMQPVDIALADGPNLIEPQEQETWSEFWEVAFVLRVQRGDA